MFHIDFTALRKGVQVKERRNGLRHSFISAHFAAHSDEGLTASQTAYRWLRALEGAGIIRCVKRGDPKTRKATECRYFSQCKSLPFAA
jgi:hypothetical protein